MVQRGYEVLTFPEPGLCPLHAVRECPCPAEESCADLIISDVDMLNVNGIDYIERLVVKGCKQRHFALMSGQFSDNDLARASKLGCVAFTKPLEMDVIAAWVEMVERSIPPGRVLYHWVAAY
jgi:DNA-binding NarL/FixJ family response regulator